MNRNNENANGKRLNVVVSSLFFGTVLAIGSPLATIQPSQHDENPGVIQVNVPTCPAIALAAHDSGTVVVDVQIDSDGKVSVAKAISGPPLLVSVSRNAALGWRFEAIPESKRSRRVQLTFDFDVDASRCKRVSSITPYHLRIAPEPPPETVSYIPDNAETYCKVHGGRLLRDRVEIIYGLVDTRKAYEEAENKIFPNARSDVFGGCLIEKETCDGVERQWSPKYAEVLYCPKCRRAQEQWLKNHPAKRAQS